MAIIPSIVGGAAGAGAPIGLVWLKELNSIVYFVAGMALAIAGGAVGGGVIMAIVPQFAMQGAALGAGVRAVTGIVALSSYRLQTDLGDNI